MKLDLSADRILFSRNRKKSQNAILKLSVLATEARTGIDENNHLASSIIILKRIIKNNKLALSKLTSYKQVSIKEAQKLLNEEKQELLLLNKNLKGERNVIKLKYVKTKNEINQTLSNLKTELDILVNRKFIYENALIEKESIIKKIKNNIKEMFKIPYPLVKEEEREIFLNMIDSEIEFNESLDRLQVELMLECKCFNKYQQKYLNLLDNKNLLFDEIEKIKNKKIPEKKPIEKIYEDIEKLGDEDSLLNETISSVYEDDCNNMEFPTNVIDKCLIDKNKLYKNYNMPKLAMSQIIYNKKRYKPEDYEKSLSRILVNPTSSDLKIKQMKDNIRKLKKKNGQKLRRIKEFEEKIKKMEKILQNYSTFETENKILKIEKKIKEKPFLVYSK